MKTKEYLEQAYWLDKRINSKLDLLDSLKSLATKATSTLSDMPRCASPDPHRGEGIIVKIVDMAIAVEHDIDVLIELKQDIAEVIEQVTNAEQRMLLEQRYLSYKPWAAIASSMGYSERRIFELHGIALKKIVV